MTLQLRPYQSTAIDGLRAAMRAGKKRVILYSPTGSGKTEMAIALIKAAESKGKRVMFVANRIQLVGQSSRRLAKAGLTHGVIQGANSHNAWARTLVCSIQTLASRGFPEGIDLIVVDEAHACGGTEAYRDLMRHAQCPVIGLSATPFSRGLGKHYDDLGGALFEDIVSAATISDLIEQGFLVDVDIYAPDEPDLRGVKITAGDYNEKQLGERVNVTRLIGNIVEQWKKLAGGKQTVCFATNIAHSQNIVSQFVAAGVPAEHIDCFTEEEDRQAILRRLENGTTRVVSNVSVLAEGWDCPQVEVMILARPTKSLVRYIQMVGRVLRPAPGKDRAIMLDHSGTAKRLGFPTDDLPLELDDGRPKEKATAKEEQEKEEALPKVCPMCSYVKPAKVHKCPRCGHEPARPDKVTVGTGELVKLERTKATKEQKQAWWSQLLTVQRDKGYSRGWTSNKYKEKFGVWPVGMVDRAAPVTPEVRGWIQYTNIKYAKAREKTNA